jgi:ribonuclease HI
VWALEEEELVEHIIQLQEQDARGWLAAIFEMLPHDKAIRVAVVLWAIRYSRRKAIYKQTFQSPLSTHSFIERFLSDLDMGMPTPEEKRGGGQLSTKHRWIPPPMGRMNINVDVALSKISRIGAVAAVARDETGKFLGASVVVVTGFSDAEQLEAMACREVLAHAADLDLLRFRVASDCLNVVRSVHGAGMGSYSQIIKEIKARMVNFTSVNFVHEGRESNVDAHTLARHCIYMSVGRYVWLLSLPDGICNSLTMNQ